MILDAIFGIFEALAQVVLNLLPDIEPPDLQGLVAATSGVWGALGWLNKYAPVAEAGVALALFGTYWLVMHTIQLVNWIGTKARLLGGS